MSTATTIAVPVPLPTYLGDRASVRCFYCHLVQFANQYEVCRRCHKKYFYEPEPVVLPTLSLREVSPGRSLPDVGRAVKFSRSIRGLSQAGLARNMRTRFRNRAPRTYVSKLENHCAYPKLSSLDNLARGLGIPVYWLLLIAESFS